MPYFVAGYPTFRRTAEALWEAKEAGASLVELGIPFSDPVADGPAIQAAIHQSLADGATPRKCLDLVRSLRKDGFDLPILGMTYANVLHAPGLDAAADRWAAAGLDGAIVPDVPAEEAAPLRTSLRREGLGTVSFASPGTGDDRLRAAMRGRDAFVYLVAVYGTTGARTELAPETLALVRRAIRHRRRPSPPVCVGFGISRPEHVRALHAAGADGAVVGSALLPRLARGGGLRKFLAEMVRAGALQHARH